MRLDRLLATGFRNLAPLDLATDAPFVVWFGPNGHGKTNVLEAVHWLCALKPLRTTKTRELIAWDADSCSVGGRLDVDGAPRAFRVDLGAVRRISVDDSQVGDLAEYFAGIRCIAFQPSDAEIIGGEPSRRRAWIDRAAFTAFPGHLAAVKTFRRVVEQKAALLRGPSPDVAVLDVLDEQLAAAGAALVERRVAILDALRPVIVQLHATISSGLGDLGVTYRTTADGDRESDRTASLRSWIAKSRRDELRRRQVLIGPHLDDLAITLSGRPTRGFASRGQARSIALAFKLGELVASRARGEPPLFLIDDVSSELDGQRNSRVLGLLLDLGAQVFATTADPTQLAGLPADRTRWLRVEAGRVVEATGGPTGTPR